MINAKILEMNQLAFESVKQYKKKRFLYETLTSEVKNKSITILTGPRGVGKTILLKQLIKNKKNSFYLSVDQIDPTSSLFDIVKTLNSNYGVKFLILDEIHYHHNYAIDLKSIYDFIPIKVFITSSISLKLNELAIDLSRRAKIFNLNPFSFREFVYFEKNKRLPPLSLENAFLKKWHKSHLEFGYLFHSYLSGRLYPFTLEEPNFEKSFKSVLHKIIHSDLPIIGKLSPIEISTIEKILAHIARSGSDGISYSSISKNLGITKYYAEQFIRLLQKAHLLNVLYPEGANVIKEPKILMTLPFRTFYVSEQQGLGANREDFVVEALIGHGLFEVHYLKSNRGEKTPDFLITNSMGESLVIEVGGKGKGRSQFKGISIDKKYIVVDSLEWKENQIPMFLLSMY